MRVEEYFFYSGRFTSVYGQKYLVQEKWRILFGIPDSIFSDMNFI
jgi:hypothetical protein